MRPVDRPQAEQHDRGVPRGRGEGGGVAQQGPYRRPAEPGGDQRQSQLQGERQGDRRRHQRAGGEGQGRPGGVVGDDPPSSPRRASDQPGGLGQQAARHPLAPGQQTAPDLARRARESHGSDPQHDPRLCGRAHQDAGDEAAGEEHRQYRQWYGRPPDGEGGGLCAGQRIGAFGCRGLADHPVLGPTERQDVQQGGEQHELREDSEAGHRQEAGRELEQNQGRGDPEAEEGRHRSQPAQDAGHVYASASVVMPADSFRLVRCQSQIGVQAASSK